MPSATSSKLFRKGLGLLLIVLCVLISLVLPTTDNGAGLTIAIGLTTVGVILLFLG